MKIPGEEIIDHFLLKTRTRKNRTANIIQNHGFISKFLKGAYGRFPNTLISSSSNQEYGLSIKDKTLSLVKKFLKNPIVYKF